MKQTVAFAFRIMAEMRPVAVIRAIVTALLSKV
jgi:hypothetical protein